jgi:hypothetical protein
VRQLADGTPGTLARPTMTTGRKIGMGALRLYLVVATILDIIKIVQVAPGNKTTARPNAS